MRFSLPVFCVVAASSLTVIHAQTYVNQTFDALNNNRSTQNPPTSLEWGYSPNAANANETLSAETGAMVYTPTIAAAQYATAYFTPSGSPITILDGESITLSFDFAFSSLAAADSGMQFGLYNSGGTRLGADFSSSVQLFANDAVFLPSTGYGVQVNPGATTGVSTFSLRRKFGSSGATNFSNTGTIGTNNAAAYLGLTPNTFSTASITITRVGDSSVVSSTVNGITQTGTLAGGGTFAFDTIGIFTSTAAVSVGNTFTFDNVNVTVVPEPSTYALLITSLVIGGLVYRRRRSTQAAA